MRLHRLRATAFGPFAGTVELDFDEVSAEGLFLVHGPTGAGKTSILDAVCFALYSGVPGARPSGRSLRSDHATRDVSPSVVLEFSACGRRLRITRSPQYLRPKRRGTGEVATPARVTLEELVDRAWKPLSTRNDEVAEVLDDVLGMGLEQFGRVVLLPQGEFAAFLRASVEERRQVLERLFDVSAFVGVEAWLAEQRRAHQVSQAAHQSALGRDLAVLAEALTQVPDGVLPQRADWLRQDPEGRSLETLPDQLREVSAALQGFAAEALAACDRASSRDVEASRRLEQGRSAASARQRARSARKALERVADTAVERAQDRARLERAGAADAVSGELRALQRAEDELLATADSRRVAGQSLGRLGLEDRSAASVALWVEQLTTHDQHLARARHLEQSLGECRRRRLAREKEVTALGMEVHVTSDRLDKVRSDQVRASEELAAATHAAAGLDGVRAGLDRASRRHQLRLDQDTCLADIERLSVALQSARTLEQDTRERLLDLREGRLTEMAGELAEKLAEGDPCPVCGSCAHPTLAHRGRSITEDDISTADESWSEAKALHHHLEVKLAALEAARDGRAPELVDQADAAALEAVVVEATEVVRETQAAALLRTDAELAVQELVPQAETLGQTLQRLRQELASATATERDLSSRIERDDATVGELLAAHRGSCPCTMSEAEESVDAVWQQHRAVVAAGRQYLVTIERLEQARKTRDAAAASVTEALADKDFDDLEQATAALLGTSERAALQGRVKEHDTARISAETVLADEGVRAAEAGPAPDLEALADVAQHARAELLESKAAQTTAEAGLRDVTRLHQTIVRRCEELGPVLAAQARLSELADLVAGTGADNAKRMRLSSFVLAARLERVVERANERLSAMGDGRFQLQHDDGLAARGARSGLGLVVRDLWTGQSRDTSTLSGGESFMASLALALGLAEAVREDSGGFDLQTLFVDEGFGSLDESSLEQVMGVLDGLREGGRAVGIVSHVSDLRSRITAQIVVDKTPHGSTARVLRTSESAPAA